MVNLKSPNFLIATMMMLMTFVILLVVLLKELGGSEAVFAILGYLTGWVSSIVLFFFRKAPPGENK